MVFKNHVFRNLLFTALILIFLSIAVAEAATFCVSTPNELQTALNTAATNGEDDVVQVLQGTYVGSFIYSSNEVFDIYVKGGYTSGCGSRTVDPANTVLDANNTGPALALTSNQAAKFMVKGLTLQDGTTSNGNGGGLYAHADGGNVTLTNNIIANNSATGGQGWGSGGGGVHVDVGYGTATLTSNTISNNSAEYDGGGVYVYTFQEVTPIPAKLVNNVISGNTSSILGGGLHVWGRGNVTLKNNTITNNTCQPCQWGGGGINVYLIGDDQTADIYNNIIWGNIAPNGRDIDIDNDGNDNYFKSPVNLFNNDFDHSVAGFLLKYPFLLTPAI